MAKAMSDSDSLAQSSGNPSTSDAESNTIPNRLLQSQIQTVLANSTSEILELKKSETLEPGFTPFRGAIDIVGLDNSVRELSIRLWLKVELLLGRRYTGGREAMCKVTAEKIDISTEKSAEKLLQVRQLHLVMSPSMEAYDGSEEERKRRVRDIHLCSPQPTQNVEYILPNHFRWRHEVSKDHDACQTALCFDPEMNHHLGCFAYTTDTTPTSIHIKVTAILSLPPPSVWRKAFIRDRDTEYPCRNFKFEVDVEIRSGQDGEFIFPREGKSASMEHLGKLKFSTSYDGNIYLDINQVRESSWESVRQI
jgi:hypothetical protein